MPAARSWLHEAPTTNLRILVGLAVYVGVVATICGNVWRGRPVPDLDSLFILIAVIAGVDVTQWIGKRLTAWKPQQTDSEIATGEPIVPPSARAPRPPERGDFDGGLG